eukprot:scaffold110769_cov56-Attheya_sp.AAC.1
MGEKWTVELHIRVLVNAVFGPFLPCFNFTLRELDTVRALDAIVSNSILVVELKVCYHFPSPTRRISVHHLMLK